MSRSARSSRAAWTATRTGPGPGTGVFVRRYSRHITIGAAGVTPADRTGSKKQKNEQIIMTARASVIHVIEHKREITKLKLHSWSFYLLSVTVIIHFYPISILALNCVF